MLFYYQYRMCCIIQTAKSSVICARSHKIIILYSNKIRLAISKRPIYVKILKHINGSKIRGSFSNQVTKALLFLVLFFYCVSGGLGYCVSGRLGYRVSGRLGYCVSGRWNYLTLGVWAIVTLGTEFNQEEKRWLNQNGLISTKLKTF